ncbi:MAG: inosine/xanthosine triphosphatase [Anaerolineaceae bacterium]|nr:inosine/xanthosine triphosphatase [Anaerolineaceae bacterium]
MKKIIVASNNPVKAEAVLNGFKQVFAQEKFSIQGVGIASNVSDQPIGDHETLQGARNRAKAAKEMHPEADYWAGLEGGVDKFEEAWVAFAWIVILSRKGEGIARTGIFTLPPEVAKLIQSGIELGEADDIVFGTNNSKQANGAVGLLSGDALTRSGLYTEGVILALIPIKNEKLYLSI